MGQSTKERLIEAGLEMLLERGYNDLGVQALLEKTGVPKGSFYHHFKSKEDFCLEVIERYMADVHQGLDLCLTDASRAPLARVRYFFELSADKYRREGYFGCLLGGLGQELSGVSDVFRRKIEWCLSEIAGRIAECLDEARARGELPADADTRRMADLIVNCWEGAALRSRLWRNADPLMQMLDFHFGATAATEAAR